MDYNEAHTAVRTASPSHRDLIWRMCREDQCTEYSARGHQQVDPGAVNTEVTLKIAPGVTVVSIITKEAAEGLGLRVGSKAYAVIKASSVMVGVD